MRGCRTRKGKGVGRRDRAGRGEALTGVVTQGSSGSNSALKQYVALACEARGSRGGVRHGEQTRGAATGAEAGQRRGEQATERCDALERK